MKRVVHLGNVHGRSFDEIDREVRAWITDLGLPNVERVDYDSVDGSQWCRGPHAELFPLCVAVTLMERT